MASGSAMDGAWCRGFLGASMGVALAGVPAVVGSLACAGRTGVAERGPLVYEQDFERAAGAADFVCTDPAVWRIDRGSLRQERPGVYVPRFRSPENVALLRTMRFGSFELEADLMQTGREYPHRDMCVVFGFQDPDHYCYAHLSTSADENAHNVFVVDGSARAPITTRRSTGVDWGREDWRHARVEFDAGAGTVRVLLDGQEALFSDRVPFREGLIGFGTFDDEGRVDNVRIWADGVTDHAEAVFQPVPMGPGEEGPRFEQGEGRLHVLLGDRPFAAFVYDARPRPFIAPVLGPGGERMTRAYPMEEVAGEERDHPHHAGLWWAHGDINGVDLWQGDGVATLIDGPHVSRNWVTASYAISKAGTPTGLTLMESFGFGETLGGDRYIDCVIGLMPAPGGRLDLGDTKEGTMAIRTHPALRLTPGPGEGAAGATGRARNSRGVEGREVWGKRAEWVDYSGEINGAPVGIAVFDHPANPRHPTWWHAREYGLVAANPFGVTAFEGGEQERGRLTRAAGQNLVFRYRFLFHRFDTDGARVGDAYSDWASDERRPEQRFDWIAGSARELNDDAGWCWFEGERAVVVGKTLVFGSVAAGVDDNARRGDIELTLHDLTGGGTRRIELHDKLELDDHDQPGLCDLGEGRVLALWSRHGPDNRIYGATVDIASGEVVRLDPITPGDASRVTYSNVFRLADEGGRLYDFFRGLGGSWKPSFIFSDDEGRSWALGNTVIDMPGEQRHRPYARYASDGEGQIHILYSEGHPRDFDNSIHHVFYRAGELRRTDGAEIAPLAVGLERPDLGSLVYADGPDHVAWPVDLRLGPDGRPVAIFSVQVGSAGEPVGRGGDDLRYWYARWDGGAWFTHELARAGTRLYPGEDDYTGLACISPSDPAVVVISTNADPSTGEALVSGADRYRHWELFRGTTPDGGGSWAWEPLTMNSTEDNLRPVFAVGGGGPDVLLWLRGVYRAYTDFDQRVMELPLP